MRYLGPVGSVRECNAETGGAIAVWLFWLADVAKPLGRCGKKLQQFIFASPLRLLANL